MQHTEASLFCGGRLFECGAQKAGLRTIWGVESKPAIADVAEQNFAAPVIRALVQDVDYSALEAPFWLHMSPPCTNASSANQQAGETQLDLDMADACCRAIRALRSPVVSLENVWGYRTFESFKRICKALKDEGYAFDYWHLNSADYGVPQTRKRLILIASRLYQPTKPTPTHQEARGDTGQLAMFAPLPPWIGWYAAIEDMLDELPETDFAEWQYTHLLDRGLFETVLVPGANDFGVYGVQEPVNTVTVGSLRTRAFLLSGENAGSEWGKGYRVGAEPAPTLSSSAKGTMRAFIVHANDMRTMPVRDQDEPVFTIVAGGNHTHAPGTMPRAFIVDGQSNDGGSDMTVRDGESPAFAVTASQAKRPARAWLSYGRVVKMTPRALARFQSVPDWYVLPERNGLACKVIGNGVPSELVYQVVWQTLEALKRLGLI